TSEQVQQKAIQWMEGQHQEDRPCQRFEEEDKERVQLRQQEQQNSKEKSSEKLLAGHGEFGVRDSGFGVEKREFQSPRARRATKSRSPSRKSYSGSCIGSAQARAWNWVFTISPVYLGI